MYGQTNRNDALSTYIYVCVLYVNNILILIAFGSILFYFAEMYIKRKLHNHVPYMLCLKCKIRGREQILFEFWVMLTTTLRATFAGREKNRGTP